MTFSLKCLVLSPPDIWMANGMQPWANTPCCSYTACSLGYLTQQPMGCFLIHSAIILLLVTVHSHVTHGFRQHVAQLLGRPKKSPSCFSFLLLPQRISAFCWSQPTWNFLGVIGSSPHTLRAGRDRGKESDHSRE